MRFEFITIIFLILFFLIFFPVNLSREDILEDGSLFIESGDLVLEDEKIDESPKETELSIANSVSDVDLNLPDSLEVVEKREAKNDLIGEESEEGEEGAGKEESIKEEEKQNIVLLSVPFLTQAPLGNWADPRQQDGCEEASALMAVSWARGVESITPTEAREDLLAISDYELEKYDNFHDTSASSTVDRILKDYFDYHKVRVEYDIETENIITELEKGNLIIAPFNGQKLNNIYYTPPGAERHMLVIVGYDYDTREFITNDPGTRHGAGYRYAQDILFKAIRDYPTGNHLPIVTERRAMIVIEKD